MKHINLNQMSKITAGTKYYYALYEKEKGKRAKALDWINDGIKDFLNGHSKERPYNEEIKQVYLEQLIELENQLKSI